MEPTTASASLFRFGIFEADSVNCTLTRSGARIKIQEQPFRLLLILLERPGEIVSREELRQRLWPEGTYVDFDGSLNVLLKRLRATISDDPENPRFIETVPRRGYRFIAPVAVVPPKFEQTPAKAPENGSAQVSPQAPSVVAPSASVTEASATKAARLRYWLAAAMLAVAATIVLGGWLLWHYRFVPQSASRKPAVQMRRSVAVLGFQNLSRRGDEAWLATALSEMLSTELAGGEKLRLVSGEDIANLRVSAPWPATDTLDRVTSSRIGDALNSDVLVLGSYVLIGSTDEGQLRLDVRMQDGKTGEILSEVGEAGEAKEMFRLVSQIGTQLRNRLGIGPLQGSDEAGVLAALPLDPDAARFYALGVAKLRQFDALAAKDLLSQAAEADPKFSLVHAMLARAWAQLGYEQKHAEEAKKAFDLSADLPRAQRMLVEGEYYESLGKQEEAASVYHALFELFPDNLDYGLQLAASQTVSGHGGQAMRVIQQLRTLSPPSSDDPRIDLAEALAMKDNKPAALVLIRSAVRKASDRGQLLLYALARKQECMNLLYGEKPEQATPVCEDAYNLFIGAGNRLGAADAVRLLADGIGAGGHFEQAIATYERALNLLAGMGEHEKTGAILNNMAINYANEGKLDRAEELYEQAKFHFQQAGDRGNTSDAMVNIADIYYLRGNLPRAAKLYQDTLTFISTMDHGDPGYALFRLADLELAQGNVKEGHRLAQQAVDAIGPTQGSYQYLTSAMIEVGEALKAEGDLTGARSQFEQTLAMRQKIGSSELAAESQAELADLAVHEDHPEQAESLIRPALELFEKEKSDPDSSSAYTILSRALLMQGKFDEANKASRRAAELSLTSSDPALKLPAAIEQARVQAANPNNRNANSAAAFEQLHSTISTAKRLGYYQIECEGRLALGELELKLNSSLGRKHLTELATETRSHNLELLARRAEGAIVSGAVVAENRSAH
jgi:DNA-binding winged helix-turn-helix (wHTH) protein/tetratricopeptide (TPR) repeat protein